MNLTQYISELSANARAARAITEGVTAPQYAVRASDAPVVALLSPHPDDECIVGGLALRLGVQSAWRVVNLAITVGSDPTRQTARALELRAACDYLGFECERFGERGLIGISHAAHLANDEAWRTNVSALAKKLDQLRPALLLAPHPHDGHAAHVGTYWLMLDALALLPKSYAPHVALTEYWSTMELPNLLVQLSPTEVAQLVSGLLCHAGEIARNPYHASLPLWMMENVRRGSERVGAPGSAAAAFDFATIYTLLRWREGKLKAEFTGGKLLASSDSAEALIER